MTIIIFILILLVCVLVHEWGHYIVAKKSGMLVEEFGFGIPPRIFSWKKGETVYSINAIPIGGFVKIAGENGQEDGISTDRQFDSKPWYKKTAVLFAGVICNFLLAIILFTISYNVGLPAINDGGTPTITNISQGTPAEKAGLSVGDTIQSIKVGKFDVNLINTKNIYDAIQKNNGPVIISYTNNKKVSQRVSLEPVKKGDIKIIGLGIEPISVIKQPLLKSFNIAIKQSLWITKSISLALFGIIQGLFSEGSSSVSLMGPVGLAKEVAHASTFGLAYLLAFTATISLNLAVLNIVPFPALDGGRIIIVWAEAITKRKMSKTAINVIHTLGFLSLILLMIVLTIGDIRKIF